VSDSVFFVFDVESVGLHGEGYAYGYVVVDREGNEIESGECACDPSLASGPDSGRVWITQNAPRLTVTKNSPREVIASFVEAWKRWKGQSAIMAADCPWPVEARFLIACDLGWDGPYPLIDVGSVVFAVGGDAIGSFERLENERPAHDPLCDARQSARVLVEHLQAASKGNQ